MKDLELSRLIHVAAASAFLLSTTSCGGKKKEEEEDPIPEKGEALGSFCEATEFCEPEQFASQYYDVDDCVDSASLNYEEAVAENGEACGKAMRALLGCLGEVWPETCDLYDASLDCVSESLDAYEECEYLGF